MNDARTIVILGGGVGGVIAATSLRKKLDEQHRVIIVDRERDHVFARHRRTRTDRPVLAR